MRIPPEDRSRALSLGLNTWVARREFPFEDYCQTIDDARAIIRRHQPAGENFDADWNQVLPIVAKALDNEGTLEDHAINKGYDVAIHGVWWDICCAAAWVVMARYDAALEEGKWTPQ